MDTYTIHTVTSGTFDICLSIGHVYLMWVGILEINQRCYRRSTPTINDSEGKTQDPIEHDATLSQFNRVQIAVGHSATSVYHLIKHTQMRTQHEMHMRRMEG